MNDSVEIIYRAELCISCGACANTCPQQNVRMVYDERREKYEARVQDTSLCPADCGRNNCLAVCPSFETDFVELSEADRNGGLGRIEAVFTGASADAREARAASTAGVTRRLLADLLDAGAIDAAIALTHDEGMDHTPKLLRDLSEASNSIYHNVNFEAAIRLIEENPGRFAVVALPCQMEGIVKYLRLARKRRLAQRIALKVCLICGYSFSRTAIKLVAAGRGIDRIDEVSYRGGGKRGRLVIRHPAGEYRRERTVHHSFRELLEFQMLFHPMLCQKRCLCCVDHLGYPADVVVGDAWLERLAGVDEGVNLIVARTPAGLAALRAAGGLCLEPAEPEDLRRAQGLYATGAAGEYFLRQAGRRGFAPTFQRGDLNLPAYRPPLVHRFVKALCRPLILRKRRRAALALLGLTFYRAAIGYALRRLRPPRRSPGEGQDR